MNQEKIGKFIAERRKLKKLTQLKLADKLGVTDRSISNWENGICLPDASVYKQLCNILEISMNDLFAGEIVKEVNEREDVNSNLLNILERRLFNDGLKRRLFNGGNVNIDFEEFQSSLNMISETILLLSEFETKDEAVKYLVKETKLPEQECSNAYDFYINLNSDSK